MLNGSPLILMITSALFETKLAAIWVTSTGPINQRVLLHRTLYIYKMTQQQISLRLSLTMHWSIIAVFNNMPTLEFKPQPTVYIFCCRHSSKLATQKTEVYFSWVKRSWLRLVDFDPFVCFCFSRFIGCCHNCD